MELDRALACAYAQIAATILRSVPRDPSDRQASAERHADLAVRALARAVAAGALRGPEAAEDMLSDSHLDPLRSRPDFQLMMMDLQFPDDPFARGD
jgi:serine/threonine-protein kinase